MQGEKQIVSMVESAITNDNFKKKIKDDMIALYPKENERMAIKIIKSNRTFSINTDKIWELLDETWQLYTDYEQHLKQQAN